MTIKEQAKAIKGYSKAIDAAILSKGGETEGGLKNAAEAIGSIPTGTSERFKIQPWVNDGWFHVWVMFTETDWFKPYVSLRLYNAIFPNGIEVDWGDGQIDTIAASATKKTPTLSHAYSARGTYHIRVSGYDSFEGSPSNLFDNDPRSKIAVRQIECGSRITNLQKIAETNVEAINLSGNTTSVSFSGSGLRYVDGAGSAVATVRIFTACPLLREVAGLSTCESIGNSAFEGCASLEDIGELPMCTTIGAYAFSGCAALKSVGTLSTCVSVGSSVFSGCTALANGVNEFHLENVQTLTSLRLPEQTAEGASTTFYWRGLRDLGVKDNIGLFVPNKGVKRVVHHFAHSVTDWESVANLANWKRLVTESGGDGYKELHFDGIVKSEVVAAISVFPWWTGNTCRYYFSDTPDGHYWTYANSSDKDGTYH